MPFNSVSLYVKGLIDNLTIPGSLGWATLSAQITPYDPDESGAPTAYIWPSRGREVREASPRGPATVGGAPSPDGTAGVKHLHHMLDIYLTSPVSDTDPDPDSAFPALIDIVMAALRGSADPAPITDSVTGFASELVDVGENMDVQYPPLFSLEDQRLDRYVALITMPVLEQFSA